jgi:hypothetical protein
MNAKTQRGQTLVEIAVVLFITGSTLVVAGSAADSARHRVAIAAATSELRATIQRARALAIAHDRNVAIRFQQDGNDWTWGLYEDGDGDGVRNDDISHKVDRPIMTPRKFQHRPARIGVPVTPVIDPTNGQPLASRPPVRFGSSMLCSFSREGEASNGSVVVTDGTRAAIVRVQGNAARINVFIWDGKAWKTTV